MTQTRVTADTITDEQIETLRDEASEAGDLLQVAICDVALATGLSEIADVPHEYRIELEALGIIPEHVGADVVARAECARVILAERERRIAYLMRAEYLVIPEVQR